MRAGACTVRNVNAGDNRGRTTTGDWDAARWASELEAFDPDVIGGSAYVWSLPVFVPLMQFAKRQRPDRLPATLLQLCQRFFYPRGKQFLHRRLFLAAVIAAAQKHKVAAGNGGAVPHGDAATHALPAGDVSKFLRVLL